MQKSELVENFTDLHSKDQFLRSFRCFWHRRMPVAFIQSDIEQSNELCHAIISDDMF